MKKETAEKAAHILTDIACLEQNYQIHPITNPVIEVKAGGWHIATITASDNNPHYQAIIDSLVKRREDEIQALYKELEDLKDE